MRRLALLFLGLSLACSQETPTPAPSSTATTATTATSATQSQVTTTSVPPLQTGTYDEALLWLRSTNGFPFVIDEGDVHVEGEMTRTTPGAEKVQFRGKDGEWQAEARPQGVVWKRREGGSWKEAAAPPYGARIYQRVTVPFDPQKKEGVPLLVSSEGETNLYRFTNANSGDVHEVWVRKSDSSIARMKIGESVEMTIGR
jgi:hypothetical protein